MALAAGDRIGPYEIVSPLGAGGMGEVYRAVDARLKRQVAIKILSPAFAADPGRLSRFEREAEVLASLNHPLIGAIYGVEESAHGTALVMELVDGPTLADRIEQGALPIDDAIGIASQIAEALEAAHEQGVVHRDLKPANIKLRDDGTVKVLDFGLAKPQDKSSTSHPDLANSPTMASPHVSIEGMILGTAAYMSPEQARGKAVDKRTDVWAFGAVLYEMLSGVRAFDGEDATEIIAAVVKTTPDWSKLPPSTPKHIVTLIQQCLDKDRRTRIGDIAVARFVLSGAGQPAAGRVSSSSRSSRLLPAWIALALIVGGGLGWFMRTRVLPLPPTTFAQISVQPAQFLTPSRSSGIRPSRLAFALSPDGRRLVYSGVQGDAINLYVRDLSRPEAIPMKGTENGLAPFFSADGSWIGFIAGNEIKKSPLSGGPPTTICTIASPNLWGASWADDDTIYFGARDGIFKVPASGGTPAQVTKTDLTKNDRHLLPHALPGGHAILYTSPPNVMFRSLDSNEEHVVVEDAADARYVDGGYLMYMKSGTLLGAPFDAEAGKVSGAAVTLIDNVMQGVNASNAADETEQGQFATSRAGHLVFAPGGITPSRTRQLMWVDRTGKAKPVAGIPVRPFLMPRLSPDEEKIAVEVRADTSRETDVWVYDSARGSGTRLTFEGGGAPVWSPDGKSLASAGLRLLKADGSGKPEPIANTASFDQLPESWARSANIVAFLQRPSTDSYGIWTVSMAGAGPHTPKLFLESKWVMRYPEIAPDGRAIAYVSLETGSPELYVQAFPDGGEKIRVSINTAAEPIWTANGKELLYRADTKFYSAVVHSTSPLKIDPPYLLFEAKPNEYDMTTPLRSWDASADGRGFILPGDVPSKDTMVTQLQLIMNWSTELRRRLRQ